MQLLFFLINIYTLINHENFTEKQQLFSNSMVSFDDTNSNFQIIQRKYQLDVYNFYKDLVLRKLMKLHNKTIIIEIFESMPSSNLFSQLKNEIHVEILKYYQSRLDWVAEEIDANYCDYCKLCEDNGLIDQISGETTYNPDDFAFLYEYSNNIHINDRIEDMNKIKDQCDDTSKKIFISNEILRMLKYAPQNDDNLEEIQKILCKVQKIFLKMEEWSEIYENFNFLNDEVLIDLNFSSY